jgi:hypothetical protein
MRIALLSLFLTVAPDAWAQQGPTPPKGTKAPAKSIPLTPEREAAALAFAKTNHPELAELLGNLKTMDESQYKSAVSTLASQADQLAALAKRDPEIHAVALKEWKTQSRIGVLAAKITHLDPSAKSSADGELRKLIEDQAGLRIARKELEVKRTAEQLRKAEEQLQKLRSDKDAWIAQQLKRWLRTKDRPKAKPKATESPSKKPGTNP